MKRILSALVAVLLVFGMTVCAQADTQINTRSFFDRVFDFDREGIISVTLTYDKVTSPTGELKKGTKFNFSGSVELRSLTGFTKKSKLNRISFVITTNGDHVVSSRDYTIKNTVRRINIKDYAADIQKDIEKLDVGSYAYSLDVDYTGKIESETVNIAKTEFAITVGTGEGRITIEGGNAPGTLKKGQNFGLRGVVRAENGKLTWVACKVTNAAGQTVLASQRTIDAVSHDIRNTLNNDIQFGKLAAGEYTYTLQANMKTYAGETISRSLIQRKFTVKGNSVTPATVTPEPVTTKPNTGSWGEWSAWSTQKTTASDTRQVETETRYETTTVYVYRHWHYTHKKNGAQNSYAEYKGSQYVAGSGKWEYYTVSTPLKQTDVKDGRKRYKVNGVSWYNETKQETTQTVVYYRYRDRK